MIMIDVQHKLYCAYIWKHTNVYSCWCRWSISGMSWESWYCSKHVGWCWALMWRSIYHRMSISL